MRKGIVPITLIAVLMAAVLLPGCTTTGPGRIVTIDKDFSDFTSVAVEGNFKVEITRSDIFGTTISADASFADYIAVDKEGKQLRIYLNPRHTFTDFTLQAKTLKVKITMPALNGLHLSGATDGKISGFKSLADFSLNVSGASSVDINDIEAGNAEFEISGASEVSGNMSASDAKFLVSGASKVKLEGSANNITLDTAGASEVNLADFPVNNAGARLSGASEVTLNARGRLDAVLRDASRLYFLGNPTMGDIIVSGASTIKHE